MKNSKKRKKARSISFALIIIALILIIGCAAYIGYNKVTQSAESSVSNTITSNTDTANILYSNTKKLQTTD